MARQDFKGSPKVFCPRTANPKLTPETLGRGVGAMNSFGGPCERAHIVVHWLHGASPAGMTPLPRTTAVTRADADSAAFGTAGRRSIASVRAHEFILSNNGPQRGAILSLGRQVAMSRNMFGCHNREWVCYWHLVGRDQGCCWASHYRITIQGRRKEGSGTKCQ